MNTAQTRRNKIRNRKHDHPIPCCPTKLGSRHACARAEYQNRRHQDKWIRPYQCCAITTTRCAGGRSRLYWQCFLSCRPPETPFQTTNTPYNTATKCSCVRTKRRDINTHAEAVMPTISIPHERCSSRGPPEHIPPHLGTQRPDPQKRTTASDFAHVAPVRHWLTAGYTEAWLGCEPTLASHGARPPCARAEAMRSSMHVDTRPSQVGGRVVCGLGSEMRSCLHMRRALRFGFGLV